MNWRNRGFLKLSAVFQLHASPFEIGLLAAFSRLPFPTPALPVGVWIDRLPRRRVMILADVGRTLALASIPIAATAC